MNNSNENFRINLSDPRFIIPRQEKAMYPKIWGGTRNMALNLRQIQYFKLRDMWRVADKNAKRPSHLWKNTDLSEESPDNVDTTLFLDTNSKIGRTWATVMAPNLLEMMYDFGS